MPETYGVDLYSTERWIQEMLLQVCVDKHLDSNYVREVFNGQNVSYVAINYKRVEGLQELVRALACISCLTKSGWMLAEPIINLANMYSNNNPRRKALRMLVSIAEVSSDLEQIEKKIDDLMMDALRESREHRCAPIKQ